MKPFIEMIKVTASGAATVLLSTVTSCALAVVIETGAHRLQYKLFPHKYDNVKYAMGLPHLQHRHLTAAKQDDATHNAVKRDSEQHNLRLDVEHFSLVEEDNMMWQKNEVELASDNTQSRFQTYQEKLQGKVEHLSPERISKILLTTAMTG